MTLLLLSVHHRVHGLDAVERTHSRSGALTASLLATGHVRGFVELATCNRWELYVDVETQHARQVGHDFVGSLPEHGIELPARLVHASQGEAIAHLFQVAAGLDSMVLGEREITGQLRRAVSDARGAGTLTAPLDMAFTHALRAARKVQSTTGLAATGRSIVGVALDLAELDTTRPALVVGTGSYAGAAVAALRARGVSELFVHSVSGRGAEFAESHGLSVAESLADGVAGAATVVCCHGGGTVVVPPMVSGRKLPVAVVDLALSRDVDPAVGDVPGVRLVGLADVQAAAPGLAEPELAAARSILADGVAHLADALNDRRMAPALAALQAAFSMAVEDEISRLPGRQLSHDDAAHALRRLAARLAHVPLSRGREAARDGHSDEFLAGMSALLGGDAFHIDEEPWVLDPARLEVDRCPVTGMAIDDLAPVRDIRAVG